MSRRQDIALSRDAILELAFRVMEQEGIEALSMRRLAAGLSVQAPALYWHVRNKDELLGLMASRIYSEARAATPPQTDWRNWLIAFGSALHEAFRRRRDAASLCSMARPIVLNPGDHAAGIAAPLVALGLSAEDAISFQASVISLTLGWAIFEVNGPMHEFLDDLMDVPRAYETGLRALVDGYAPAAPQPTR